MNKTTQVLIALSIVLIGLGTAQANIDKVSTSATYLGWNKNWNSPEVKITVEAPESGKLVYVENYYSIDSYGKPKWYSSSRVEKTVENKKISFKILRPKDGRGQRYSLIEKALIINGQRTQSVWYDLRNSWK